jgi:hypothetical protein
MKLKIKDTYIYYDFPILFSADNEDGDTFICLFAEETGSHLRYICVKVSPAIILELENNQKDIRTVFENSGKTFNLLLNAQSEEPVEVSEELGNIASFLPDEGLFIGKSQEINVGYVCPYCGKTEHTPNAVTLAAMQEAGDIMNGNLKVNWNHPPATKEELKIEIKKILQEI